MNGRVVILSLIASWTVALLLLPVARHGWFVEDLRPSLPLVSLPYQEGRDVASSIPLGVMALVAATMCASIVEVAKFFVARTPHRAALYVTLIGYQVVLVLDAVRAYAYDWWLLLVSLAGLIQLQDVTDLMEVSGGRVPWFSGGICAAIVGLVLWLSRRARTSLTA